MTAGLSTTNIAHPWLNSVRSATAPTAYSTPFVQIHTGDPGASGTANVSAGDNTRKALTQSAASGGAIAQSGTAPSWTNGGTSETITHISVHSASTAGTFLYSIALTSSKAWVSTDTLTLNTCGVSLAPLAA